MVARAATTTSRTGSKQASASVEPVRPRRAWQRQVPGSGFTLIELILVMTILVIVLAVSAPALARFFRGRTLDSEAKRFLALTRYGQSRAVSEGIPMVLWIDSKQAEYGLQADSSYEPEDTRAVEYQVHTDLQVEVEQSVFALKQASLWKGAVGLNANLPKNRFTPDGFISESSPEAVVFKQGQEDQVWIGPNYSRVNYEIQTNQLQIVRR
jgi:type II secretion system protein H